MRIRSVRYYINEAFRGLLRNRLMSFASIITVCSCVFMLSLSYCIAINLNSFLQQMENTLGLTVYINDDVSANDVNELYSKIKALDNVKNVKYISSDDALSSFRENLGDNSALLDGLEKDNPLPRSFNIEMLEARLQSALIEELEALRAYGISEIRFQERIVGAITAINNGIRIISGILILILLTVSIVIITNTIRIAVSSRRLEINIMKYVGATDWFIRWPFVIEGVLIGIIGALIPLGVCIMGYNRILLLIYEHIPMLESIVVFVPSTEVFRLLSPICLVFGAAIGVTGSITSIRRHLHV